MSFLQTIKLHVERQLAEAKTRRSLDDLKRMAKDAPRVVSFPAALSKEFGIIAEIKRKSPSAGDMRAENFAEAPAAYEASRVVKGISVLTNFSHFGMSPEELLEIKSRSRKPVLRKDFIFTEYQIHEARAFGADAVLLMVNLINDRAALNSLYSLARELGMDALFEAHDEKEISLIPEGAAVYGLNSRRFKASELTTHLQTFDLIQKLPKSAVKVAESNIYPHNIVAEVQTRGFDAALIGTSFLKSPQGVSAVLGEFESALKLAASTAENKPPRVAV